MSEPQGNLRRMRRLATVLALATAVSAVAQTKYGNTDAITQARLKAHLEFVAHDLLEGRGTPSRGLDLACEYVATQLKLWGAKAAGDNVTFFQKFEIPGSPADNKQYTQNVVAIIPGSDPVLSKEYVAIGAHIDHVGMGQGSGDQIFNGADDDGSGTVAMLEMAHAFLTGTSKTKRSILFVWHAGEERGLWGSAHYANNPTVPINSIIAQLNIDMIGRSRPVGDNKDSNKMLTGPDSIYVVGSNRLSTELGKVLGDVNRGLYNLKYDYHYDEPNDPENIYMRSDHYNYAVKGIPIAFWFDGVHEDYHQVSDHVDRIDFRKLERVSRTIFASAHFLANRTTRPKVDEK